MQATLEAQGFAQLANITQVSFTPYTSLLFELPETSTLVQLAPSSETICEGMMDFVATRGWRNVGVLASKDTTGVDALSNLQSAASNISLPDGNFTSITIHSSLFPHRFYYANGSVVSNLLSLKTRGQRVIILVSRSRHDAVALIITAYQLGMLEPG